MSPVVGSYSCGSTAGDARTVVTVAHGPASGRTTAPHWATDTTTSSTRPGQRAGSPEATAGPAPCPAAHPLSSSAASSPSATTARTRTTCSTPPTGNDSQKQYGGGGRAAASRGQRKAATSGSQSSSGA